MLSLLLLFTSCGGSYIPPQETASRYRDRYQAPPASSNPTDTQYNYGNYEMVGQTASLRLFYNSVDDAIELHDLSNNTVWSSATDITKYGIENPNNLQKALTGSLLAITYTDIVAKEGTLNTVYSFNEPCNRDWSYIENGIAIHYEFTLLKLKVDMHIYLKDDALQVSIPAASITEGERNLLMSLQPLPSFGLSDHTEDGYILYPDGCGALLRYENYQNRPNNLNKLLFGVYGADVNDPIEDFFIPSGTTNDYIWPVVPFQAALPVFGVKKGDAAFIASVELGDADSTIMIEPEGYKINFNRVSFGLRYRNTFEIILSNISAGNSSDLQKGVKVDKKRNDQDFTIAYRFLSGDSANYSGMANRYRSVLQASGQLPDRKAENLSLELDIFCGITQPEMLSDRYIGMTTFEQAQKIIEAFLQAGISSPLITLKGWMENGYGHFPDSAKPAGSLGGSNGFKRLAAFCEEKGFPLFARFDTILAIAENGGFTPRTEAVYQGNTLLRSDGQNQYYLFNPTTVQKRTTLFSQSMAQCGENIGLSLTGFSRFLYPDYNSKQKFTSTQSAAAWQDLLASLQQPLSLEYGNLYALPYASRLFNVPIESSHTNVADEDVPFFQMVVHGLLPYSSEAGNLFYDQKLQTLQWVEFGCQPRFELTYERASALKNTPYNQLYSSYYADWIQEASSVYQDFSARLSGIAGHAMIAHERLLPELVKITYENQTVVYVNYAKEPVDADGLTIPALDYLVKEAA